LILAGVDPVLGARIGFTASTLAGVPYLLLFASAREVAGEKRCEIRGSTVAEVLDNAIARYGPDFEAVLGSCKVWVNGYDSTREDVVYFYDEVAILPPVSGG
jgi:sulfur-carrier protein